jgi:hypothetical protein
MMHVSRDIGLQLQLQLQLMRKGALIIMNASARKEEEEIFPYLFTDTQLENGGRRIA